jgi:hypothetical protein
VYFRILAVQADISGVPGGNATCVSSSRETQLKKCKELELNQVSVLSLEMFRDIDRCLNSGVQET